MNNEKVIEEYRDVVGYPNYIISNYGKLFRKEIIKLKYINGKPSNVKTPKYRLYGQVTNGYKFANLTNGKGKRKRIQFKDLVGKAFLPAPKSPTDIIVNIDGNLLNNIITNLQYVERNIKQQELDKSRVIEVSQDTQHTWDMCLLTGWKNNWSLKRVIRNFCLIENPSIVFSDEIYFKWFYKLKLKRAGKSYESFNKDCNMFIGDHSPKLSASLFSNSIEDCLKVIDSFPWKDCTVLFSQAGKPTESDFIIHARNFSKTQWSHVK